jgi:hypothetical protein
MTTTDPIIAATERLRAAKIAVAEANLALDRAKAEEMLARMEHKAELEIPDVPLPPEEEPFDPMAEDDLVQAPAA